MTIISLIVLLMSVIAHELAHGYTALYFGDNTAKIRGRLSWNPLVHIDPFGSVFLPLMLMLSGSHFLFGWAKPVPVNPYNLKDPRRNMVWVGAAGPLANIVIALVTSRLLAAIPLLKQGILGEVLVMIVVYNVILPVFNLIPIPPLDGSRVLAGLLPYRYADQYNKLEPYGILLVFLLVYLGVFRVVLNLVLPVIYFLVGGY